MAEAPKNRLAGLLAAARREDIVRTCKYGHGSLWRDGRAWSLSNHVRSGESDPQGFQSGQLQFRCALWVCPICGYIELSDAVD